MLVGVIESVAQGMIDYHVATALLCGIMASTKGFTAPSTSAKSLTIAAQMMSAGAKQQDIVNVLFSQNRNERPEPKKVESNSHGFSIMNPPKIESKPKAQDKPEQKAETIADKLAKQGVELTQEGVKDAKTGEVIKDEPVEENKEGEETPSPKKFKNPKPTKK